MRSQQHRITAIYAAYDEVVAERDALRDRLGQAMAECERVRRHAQQWKRIAKKWFCLTKVLAFYQRKRSRRRRSTT